METRQIKDAQITASSKHNSNHSATQARLNSKAGGGKVGGWSAGYNDANQWIQVTLGGYTKLTGIATQGRNQVDQWVTNYYLQYSDDGVIFYNYKEPDYYKAPSQWLPKVKTYYLTPISNRCTHSCQLFHCYQFFSCNKVHWSFSVPFFI